MSDLVFMAGSPIEIELGGNKLKFSPITIGDLADFEAWCISERIKSAIQAMGDIKSSEKIALIQGIQASNSVNVMAELSTIKGILHMIWLSLRTHQPNITEAEVGKLVGVKNLGELQALVDKLAYSGQDEDDSKNEVAVAD